MFIKPIFLKSVWKNIIYTGSNVRQMPKLIADGRVPASVSQIMQRRLNLRNDEEYDFFMNNYFDTGDAVGYILMEE
jgi:hypothetical protein